jgi:hypothetical protein
MDSAETPSLPIWSRCGFTIRRVSTVFKQFLEILNSQSVGRCSPAVTGSQIAPPFPHRISRC